MRAAKSLGSGWKAPPFNPPMPAPEVVLLYHEALREHKSGAWTAARSKLEEVLTQAPDFEDAYEALTVLFYNEKLYDDSIRTLQRWMKVNPHALMIQTNLSRCYQAKGMIAEAEAAQAEARRLTWKAELEGKKKELPAADFADRITRYQKVIAYDPADVLGYFSLGSVYLEAGRFRDAADTFEKAVSVSPTHSASYLNWGIAVENLGDKVKVQKILEKGIEVAQNQGDVLTEKKMEARLRMLKEV